jgi:hypothetical protein
MPIDGKYGKVTLENQRSLKDDEPVFVLAAHDPLAMSIIETYRTLANLRGAPIQHVERVQAALDTFLAWQLEHGTRDPSVQ